MNDYITAQAIARGKGMPCYKLFGCDHKVGVELGLQCKGDCAEAIERHKKKLEVRHEDEISPVQGYAPY
jgi:hypothetical protein